MADIDIYYSNQLVMNETVHQSESGKFKLNHTPVCKGTVTGTVYDGDKCIQSFYVSQDGKFNFRPIGDPEFFAETVENAAHGVGVDSTTLDVVSGEITIQRPDELKNVHLLVTYEYTCQ